MEFEFDTTGTVSITNGSVDVVGVGTNWVASYPGLEINIDGLSYPVKSVNSKTSMTLVHPFSGATVSGKAYTIVPVHPGTNTAVQSMNKLMDTVNDYIENGVETAYQTAIKNGFVGTE